MLIYVYLSDQKMLLTSNNIDVNLFNNIDANLLVPVGVIVSGLDLCSADSGIKPCQGQSGP